MTEIEEEKTVKLCSLQYLIQPNILIQANIVFYELGIDKINARHVLGSLRALPLLYLPL